jgi:hypothetical protein
MLIKCVEQYNFYSPFPATPVVFLCTATLLEQKHFQ